MKDKNITRISITLCLGVIIAPIALFAIYYMEIFTSDKDLCLDSGICKEGLEINTEYGFIKINEQNCRKYNWQWNFDNSECKIK